MLRIIKNYKVIMKQMIKLLKEEKYNIDINRKNYHFICYLYYLLKFEPYSSFSIFNPCFRQK